MPWNNTRIHRQHYLSLLTHPVAGIIAVLTLKVLSHAYIIKFMVTEFCSVQFLHPAQV